jgi:RNA-directed DNA polymerase
MKDRGMQALYLQALDPIAETHADSNSYGFRNERSCADAISQCYKALNGKDSATWILEGDIKSCFDTISHPWLLTHIPTEKSMLGKWLKAGYMEKSVWHASENGTPQGGILSPVLANMTLDGLETLLREKYPPTSRGGRKSKVHMVRYADDFIITGSAQALLEREVKPLVIGFLQERGLELSQEKTKITHIADGFDFLGQNIRKYNGLLLNRPSKKNVKAFLKDIRETIKGRKQAKAYNLIAELNPKIQGWANYHRHGASSKTFVHVDWAINKALWQWARRRPPKEEHPLDSEAVLSPNREPKLALLWNSTSKGWPIHPESAVHSSRNTNSQAYKDHRRMQPLRSRMEIVSIKATRSEDMDDPAEQTPTIEALEGTGRHLPALRPANHERNRLA